MLHVFLQYAINAKSNLLLLRLIVILFTANTIMFHVPSVPRAIMMRAIVARHTTTCICLCHTLLSFHSGAFVVQW